MSIFHRPEIPQKVFPRRCIDNLCFRETIPSMTLSVSKSSSDNDAKKGKDSATYWPLASWGYAAVEREPEPICGVRRLMKLELDDGVRRFLDGLPNTVSLQSRRSLSIEFKRLMFLEGHILSLTPPWLVDLEIPEDEHAPILEAVAHLRDH